MKTQNVSIVSIHPDPAKPLELDIKHILAALGSRVKQWIWRVRNLDWLGENAEAICQKVDAVAPHGLWMSSQELLDGASGVYQTIEGEFMAFDRDVDPKSIAPQDGIFTNSEAHLAITAVDGGYFEVYAKDPDVLASFRIFKDVRDEDPSLYA